MRATHKQVIVMFQRVQDYLNTNPLPPSAGYETQKQKLDELVARLSGHSTAHVSSIRLSQAETQRMKALRKALRDDHLQPISQTARALLPAAPGIEKALKMPKAGIGTQRLIQEAKGIRDAAANYASVFIEAGRPADFLEQIDVIVETLRQSLLGRARKHGQQVGAGRGMDNEIKRGRKIVSLIDAYVRHVLAGQPDRIAQWQVTKRIGALPGGGTPEVSEEQVQLPAPGTPIAA